MNENTVASSIEEVKGARKTLRSDGGGDGDKAGGEIQNYGSGLNDAVRDAEAMKSAGLLVAS